MRNDDRAVDLERRMECLIGTFAAEGLTVSDSTRENIERIADGRTTYQQVLRELREKYGKRV